MATLKIYKDQKLTKQSKDQSLIQSLLKEINIHFENWEISENLDKDSSTDEIASNFKDKIEKVLKENNFSSFDIVNIKPELEGLDELKKKFIPEHTHDDNEVRFFIDGEGLFCINQDEAIYQLLCTKGDYISVPAHTKHWFDMGSKASFKCIRFFENKEGWIAKYTDSKISQQYPLLDEFQNNN
jgi:1,2-dihydroxy-3-keto-5-methylthiopentene dioxygenase